jgi:hypothetical protein
MFYKQFLEKANCEPSVLGQNAASSKVLVQNRTIAAAAAQLPIKEGGE